MAISVENVTIYLGFCLSILINSLLMYMIRKKTTKQLGNYTYLMLTFSIFELCFSTVDTLNQPTIYVSGGQFIIFSSNPLNLNKTIAWHFNIVNLSCFGMIISLLAIHFIYRYFVVCKKDLLILFSHPYWAIWATIFFSFGLCWYLASIFLGSSFDSVCPLEVEDFGDIFNVNILKINYIGVKYFTNDGIICKKSILYALILLIIVLISATIVLVCGIKTFREMSIKRTTTSRRTLDMQRQLFKALVMQTLIPTVLLYIPLITIFVAPIFSWNLTYIDTLLLCSFVFYKILDPLAVLYLVRDYKRALKVMFTVNIVENLLKWLKIMPNSGIHSAHAMNFQLPTVNTREYRSSHRIVY